LPRTRALVAAASGDLVAALDLIEALEDADARHLPFERGCHLLVKGRLLRRARQKRAAWDTLTEALAVFERLGAATWSAQARAESQRVGLRPAAPQELTESERRVAELAATGLTNREVAERLFISPKTVEANLGRVYAKLGIRSRAELGALVGNLREPRPQT
jgi:DNA-binding CsgD family transcriptional regulator